MTRLDQYNEAADMIRGRLDIEFEKLPVHKRAQYDQEMLVRTALEWLRRERGIELPWPLVDNQPKRISWRWPSSSLEEVPGLDPVIWEKSAP